MTDILTTAPAWTRPVWSETGKLELLNRDQGPLWSGQLELPPIGARVRIAGKNRDVLTVTGYQVDGAWLMLLGTRERDGMQGNLAGAECAEILA